jgi:MraZ protein
MLFLSTYTNKLDKKGRVSVPALFRAALATEEFKGVVLFPSYKYPLLEACCYSRMQALSASVDALDQFSDAQDDLAATLFASAQLLTFDSEGRITLPTDMIQHAGFTEEVCLVGRGATFQLWAPVPFQEHQQRARARAREQGHRLVLPRSTI